MSSPGTTIPDGWDRRPDGTLIRRQPEPFTATWLRAQGEEIVGYINPDGSCVGDWVEPEEPQPSFCDDCGYAMSVHPTSECPDEATAVEAWGR